MSAAKSKGKRNNRGPAIELRGINFSYGSIPILKNVSLEVKQGVTLGFVGPNGAGKTTTFSVMAGFLLPRSGTVSMAGASPRNVEKVKGRVSILPQDAQMIANVGILPQIVFFAELVGFDGAEAEKEAVRVLEMVGLAEHVKKHPGHLSHGMSKRAGLAQAFLGDPEVVLLDEPTAGLDPFAAKQIRDLIASMRGERTVVISSHNLAEVQDLCDEIALIHQGKILKHAPIDEFTGKANLITIHVRGGHPPIDFFQKLEREAGVASVVYDPGYSRLTIHLEPDGEAEAVIKEVVAGLFGLNLSIGEVQRGTRLEDVFMDLTGGPGGSSGGG